MSEFPPPADVAVSFVAPPPARRPRPGELSFAWRIALVVTWIGAFLAYMAVWKVSEEIGIGTWWLGARSTPQPIVVRLLPFVVIAAFGMLAAYNLRRMPWISLFGAAVLAVVEDPQFGHLVGQPVGGGFVVVGGDAEQHQQPAVDGADPLARHRHLGTGHPLQQRSH